VYRIKKLKKAAKVQQGAVKPQTYRQPQECSQQCDEAGHNVWEDGMMKLPMCQTIGMEEYGDDGGDVPSPLSMLM
jgi:hypothetical protein